MEKVKEEIDEIFTNGIKNAISNPQESYKLGEEIFNLSSKITYEYGIAKSYLLKAYAGQFLGTYAEAYGYVNLALPVFIKYNDLKNQASAYNTLGFIYHYYEDHQNRLQVNLKSLAIRKKIKDNDGYMRSLNNTGDTYLKLHEYANALNYFNDCLKYIQGNARMLAVVYSNIAETNFNLKKYDLALNYVEESMKHCQSLGLSESIYYNLYIKSLIYNKLGNFSSAILQLEQAFDLLNNEEEPDEVNLINLYKESSYAYEKLNNYENSLNCLKKHFLLEKTIQNRKQEKEIKSIQFKNEITSLQNISIELSKLVETRTKELEETLETERNISYFTQELNNTNTFHEILWKLVKSCISKLNLEDCVVYLIDEKSQLLIQKAAFGPKSSSDEKITNPITIKIGDGIVGAVAKKGKYELISDTSKDKRYIIDDDIRYSELAVPIFYEKKVIGVIDSEHSKRNFYTNRHITIFKLLANIVESRIGYLKKQEAKQQLQEKIIQINENLEKEVKRKSKENTQLNHKILDQEKKAIIGEMSTILAHELNNPLATIKGGNEAIIYLFNKLLNSNFLEFITPEEIEFIIEKTHSNFEKTNRPRSTRRNNLEQSNKIKHLLHNNVDKDMINLFLEANLENVDEIKKVQNFKNSRFTLNLLRDINMINGFSKAILESVSTASNVVTELKNLAYYDDNSEKKKIILLTNFESLQVHISLRYPKAVFNLDIKKHHYIFGNEFRTIQLWSNLFYLIVDCCSFTNETVLDIKTSTNKKKTHIIMRCNPSEKISDIFNKNILNYRLSEETNSSIKLKLNIVHSILIEHKAKLKCTSNKGIIQFEILF